MLKLPRDELLDLQHKLLEILSSDYVEEVPEDVLNKVVKFDVGKGYLATLRGLTPRFVKALQFSEDDVVFRDDVDVEVPQWARNWLRNYQVTILEQVLKRSRMCGAVTVVMPPAAGKTAMCWVYIKSIPHNKAMYITMTRDLVRQAAKMMREHGIDVEVIEHDSVSLDHEVICCTVKTLFNALTYLLKKMYKKPIKVPDVGGEAVPLSRESKEALALTYIKQVDLVIADECLHGDTFVILEDGGVVPIRNFINDLNLAKPVLLGGEASRPVIKEVSTLYYIYTDYGTLITSEKHPHVVVTKHEFDFKLGGYIAKELAVKTTDDLDKNNDWLLFVEQIPHTEKIKVDPRLGYIYAFLTVYGHIEREHGNIKVFRYDIKTKSSSSSKYEQLKDKLSIFQQLLDESDKFLGKKLNYDVSTYIDGPYFIYAIRVRLDFDTLEYFEKVLKLPLRHRDIPLTLFYAPLDFIRNYLKMVFLWGMFAVDPHNKRIYFASPKPELYSFFKKLQLLLLKFGVVARMTTYPEEKTGGIASYSFEISDYDLYTLIERLDLLNDKIVKDVLDRYRILEQLYRALKRDMVRLIAFRHCSRIKVGESWYRFARILEIVPVRLAVPITVYSFETRTGIFVADGFVTHNCHHIPSTTFRLTMSINPNSTRISLTATPYRTDKREIEIFAVGGDPIEKTVKYVDLIKLGYVVPVIIIVYRRAPPEEILRRFEKLSEDVKDGRLFYIYGKKILMYEDVHRIRDILLIVNTVPKPCLVLCDEIRQAEMMFKLIQKYVTDKVTYVTSQISEDEREYIYAAVRTGKLDVLVATPLTHEGLNIESLRTLILTIPGQSKAKLLQSIGRVVRPFKGKEYAVVVDIADELPIFSKHCEKRLDFYQEHDGWYIKICSDINEVLAFLNELREKGVEITKELI